MQIRIFFITLGFICAAAGWTHAYVCEETPQRHAHHIFAEVAGERDYRETINKRWTFTLLRMYHGWVIRLYDPNQMDLTQLTPPYQFGPNPRDIFGWHFRNQNNTQPNDGTVNAPQRFREFVFSQNLEGTGGFRPSTNTPKFFEPSDYDGQGWLNIVDYGLADLEKDQQARMMYLKFAACLTWPKTEEEIRIEQNLASPVFLPEEEEQMRACGLPRNYQLEAFVKPRWLTGDFDGDEALDFAAPVIEKASNARRIAVCRAGTWLDILSAENLADLDATYLTRVEAWSVWPKAKQADFPKILGAQGDIIALEQLEKSRYFISLKDGLWQALLDYHFVEP